jgi:hypothetical protein
VPGYLSRKKSLAFNDNYLPESLPEIFNDTGTNVRI